MSDDLNPRVALWLRAVKLTPADIERVEPTEVRRVPAPGGGTLPWTIVYTQWSTKMYHDWATSLGFKRNSNFEAHELAFLQGRTMEEHVGWLTEQIK